MTLILAPWTLPGPALLEPTLFHVIQRPISAAPHGCASRAQICLSLLSEYTKAPGGQEPPLFLLYPQHTHSQCGVYGSPQVLVLCMIPNQWLVNSLSVALVLNHLPLVDVRSFLDHAN